MPRCKVCKKTLDFHEEPVVRDKANWSHLRCIKGEVVKELETITVEMMDPEQEKKYHGLKADYDELFDEVEHLRKSNIERDSSMSRNMSKIKKLEAEVVGWEKVDEERLKQIKSKDNELKILAKELPTLTRKHNKLVKKYNKLLKQTMEDE